MPRKKAITRLISGAGFSTKNTRPKHPCNPRVAEALEQRTLLSTLVVNTLADPSTPTAGTLSLREAIAQANVTSGDNTISFDRRPFRHDHADARRPGVVQYHGNHHYHRARQAGNCTGG